MPPTAEELELRGARQGGFAAAPMFLALAFLLVSSMDLGRPRLASSGRDPGQIRQVARPLAIVLTRAVQNLVSIEKQRPVARSVARGAAQARQTIARSGAAHRLGAAEHHVRVGLLNLPPPALV